jgi:PIN domain nuclease of toxin-antitoxin system
MATRILLDTHVWLWLNGAPEQIAPAARDALAAMDTEIFLSAASVWEIAVKFAAGRLTLPLPPDRFVPSRMEANGILPLPIGQEHALRAAALPLHHRDPFDRMLVAQAQVGDCYLMTAVRIFPVRGESADRRVGEE